MESLIKKIAEAYRAAGGRALLVGGTVRDRLSNRPVTDYDLEVFGLPLATITAVAKTFGPVHEIGKSFGILQLHQAGGIIDIAAPRRETKIGRGHRGFTIEVDPTITPEAAARRRDFTINAIAEDPLTGQLIDSFGGQRDLQTQTLRVVDPMTFVEDPLRVWRAIQLVGRFGLTVEATTKTLLLQLAGERHELSAQRKQAEWQKLFLLAAQPSRGLDLAQQIGLFADHPALADLVNTRQNLKSHPEGNAWAHTLLAIDQAAKLVRQYHPDRDEHLDVMLGTFLHDIGKAVARTPEGEADATLEHAHAGAPLAQAWLLDNGFGSSRIARVIPLVHDHMDLYFLEKAWPNVALGQLRRLVNQLWPALPLTLLTVREADFRGRAGGYAEQEFPARVWFPEKLQRLGLLHGPQPVLRGQDLLDLGWPTGVELGQIISAAEEYAERNNADRETILTLLQQAGSPAAGLALLTEPTSSVPA